LEHLKNRIFRLRENNHGWEECASVTSFHKFRNWSHPDQGYSQASRFYYAIAIQPPAGQNLNELRQEFQSEGWGPLAIDGDRLFVGEGEYYVDALLGAEQIETSFGIQTTIVSKPLPEGRVDLAGSRDL
jgi:hypothetical protein